MNLFVIEIQEDSTPGLLISVNSEDEALDLIERLARENEVTIDRDTISKEHGFYYGDNAVSGCWMIASEENKG